MAKDIEDLSITVQIAKIDEGAKLIQTNTAALLDRSALPRALTSLMRLLPGNYHQITGDSFDLEHLRVGLRSRKNFIIKGKTYQLKVQLGGHWKTVRDGELENLSQTDEDIERLIQMDAYDHKVFMAGLDVMYVTDSAERAAYPENLKIVLGHWATLSGEAAAMYEEDVITIAAEKLMFIPELKEQYHATWVEAVPATSTNILAILNK